MSCLSRILGRIPYSPVASTDVPASQEKRCCLRDACTKLFAKILQCSPWCCISKTEQKMIQDLRNLEVAIASGSSLVIVQAPSHEPALPALIPIIAHIPAEEERDAVAIPSALNIQDISSDTVLVSHNQPMPAPETAESELPVFVPPALRMTEPSSEPDTVLVTNNYPSAEEQTAGVTTSQDIAEDEVDDFQVVRKDDGIEHDYELI